MLDTLEIRNGSKVKGTFSSEEMLSRIEKLRQLLEQRNLDAIVFTSIQSVNYYSDFFYCSFGRPYALVVTPDRSVTISADVDGGQPFRRSIGDNLSYTDKKKDNFYKAISSVLPNAYSVGIEAEHLNITAQRKFAGVLPSSQFVDISTVIMEMRLIKSDEEIALIKHGARIADIGGAACVEALEEGIPEFEVALASNAAMTREIAATFPHIELRDSWVWFQSGINTDGAHNSLTSRRIGLGDILSLNCFPMISGYFASLKRTMFLGHCNDEQLRIWQINCEVHKRGLELIRPDARCCDIAQELNEIYRECGLLDHRRSSYGNSLGVLSHYYGRETGLEMRENVSAVLEPGMVVSMEPMIMLPEGVPGAGGYREQDMLVVTEEGADKITDSNYGPEHNIIRA